jgi:hypothetical protein
VSACHDPGCSRLRAEIREALVVAEAELELRRATVTTGGPPAPYTHTWANKTDNGALRPEYAHLAKPTGHSSKEPPA